MNDYDSDSSIGEDGPFTETNVLLGYPTREETDDITSYLGGLPIWIDGKTAPSGALAKCGVCNELMSLIMQLHADLPQQFPGHERQLYVFMCRRKACRRKSASTRVVRGVRAAEIKQNKPSKPNTLEPATPQPEKSHGNIGAALFGGSSGSANPFSSSSSTASNPFATSKPSTNPFNSLSELAAKPAQAPSPDIASLPETFASKVRITSKSSANSSVLAATKPHEPWPEVSKFPQPYPTFYFDAEYETLTEQSTPQPPTETMDLGDDGASGGGKEDKILFESAMDKTFQKFADRVEQNPEQALRYEFGGIPLLYSTTDAVGKLLSSSQKDQGKIRTISTNASQGYPGIPRCSNCGQTRVFEAQLVPHAITALEEEELTIEGMDWGTIIIGVCSKDCTPSDTKATEVGYVEEWVGVQWEELDDKK